jgi:hypothetical protein
MVILEKYKKTFLKRIKYTTAKAQKFHICIFNILFSYQKPQVVQTQK